MAASNDNNNNGTGFTVLRILQFLSITVMWGILAYFVNVYNSAGLKTPDGVMLLFIVGILASIWTISTLILYQRANVVPLWVVFWDVVAMALFIAGVVLIGNVTDANCVAYYGSWEKTTWYRQSYTSTSTPDDPAAKIIMGDMDSNTQYQQTNNGPLMYNKPCSLLKAAFGLAIANIILFFFTALLGIGIWRDVKERRENGRRRVVKEEIIETGGYPGGGSRTIIEEQKVYERPTTPPSVFLGPPGAAPGSVYDDPSASAVGYERERRRSRSESGRTRRSHRRDGSRRHSRTYVDDETAYTGRTHSRRSSSGRRMDREGPRSSVGYVRGV